MPLSWIALALLAMTPQDGGKGPSVAAFLDAWAATEALNKGKTREDKPQTSPELDKMMLWVSHQLQRYGNEIDFAEMAGTKKRACPPPKGEREFNSDSFVPYLRALPEDQRSQPIEQALFAFLDKQYPCPKG